MSKEFLIQKEIIASCFEREKEKWERKERNEEGGKEGWMGLKERGENGEEKRGRDRGGRERENLMEMMIPTHFVTVSFNIT